MLKWGSKMRPPFLNDFKKEYRTTGQPTRESKASQVLEISEFRALLKTRPFLPEGRRRISMPCPHDPCRAKYFRAVPCQDLVVKQFGVKYFAMTHFAVKQFAVKYVAVTYFAVKHVIPVKQFAINICRETFCR